MASLLLSVAFAKIGGNNMTTNNEKMSAKELEIALLIQAGILSADSFSPFDEKAYLQDLQDTNKAQIQAKQKAQLEQTCAVPTTAKFPIEMKMPKGWTVQSFMETSPSRENVLDMCCQVANLYNCDVTDTFFFEMFESLLLLRKEDLFFDDTYTTGYHDACLLGLVNWKVIKGNEDAAELARKFDEFVVLAKDLGITSEQLEQLLPYRK